jgi:hypothetical protein
MTRMGIRLSPGSSCPQSPKGLSPHLLDRFFCSLPSHSRRAARNGLRLVISISASAESARSVAEHLLICARVSGPHGSRSKRYSSTSSITGPAAWQRGGNYAGTRPWTMCSGDTQTKENGRSIRALRFQRSGTGQTAMCKWLRRRLPRGQSSRQKRSPRRRRARRRIRPPGTQPFGRMVNPPFPL